MIINFERDMLWPDTPARVATWGTPAAELIPPVSQDGIVSPRQAFVRGPAAAPSLSSNRAAYGLAMEPPPASERAVYRVQADADGEAMVGYAFAVVAASGEVDPDDADFVYLGNVGLDMAVAVPPPLSPPANTCVLFALITGDDTVSYSYLSVQCLIGRPPGYAAAVS